MNITYDRYLDAVLGGWLGKSMGGAIGAHFEGNKAELRGYAFPGAPDLAAHYAGLDGSLDHTKSGRGAYV